MKLPLCHKKAKRIINHPSFDLLSFDYDYSLIELESAVDLAANSHIRPVCLPSGSSTYTGVPAIATGWGEVITEIPNIGYLSTKLREVVLNVLSNNACQKMMDADPYSRRRITGRMMCANVNKGRKPACRGESGGGLVISRSGDGLNPNYELIGIGNLGHVCAKPKHAVVYSRVTEAMSWIHSITGPLNTCSRT